jgi:uncharacterized protein (DUF427 family)
MASGHTITTRAARVHVEVRLDGQKLADSDRPVLLDETGLPTRYYLPREDVRMDLLRPTSSQTTCPFKGQASYWSAEVGGEIHDDLVWSYESPIPQAELIAGLMSFYPDRVTLTVGGEGLAGPAPAAGMSGRFTRAAGAARPRARRPDRPPLPARSGRCARCAGCRPRRPSPAGRAHRGP